MVTDAKTTELLCSLIPKDQSDLAVLQNLIRTVQRLGKLRHADLAVARSLWAELQNDRYLNGLLEALEIYESIYGYPLPVDQLTVSDKALHEIRQIRDMCLLDGVRSAY